MRNGLAEHWRESYVCETGKSMKAADMALAHADSWRYILVSYRQVRRRETLGSSRKLTAGALVDRKLRFWELYKVLCNRPSEEENRHRWQSTTH
jgi:hypothetical protein